MSKRTKTAMIAAGIVIGAAIIVCICLVTCIKKEPQYQYKSLDMQAILQKVDTKTVKNKSFVCYSPLTKDNGIEIRVYKLNNGKTQDHYTSYTVFETKEDYENALNLAMFGAQELDDTLHMIKMDQPTYEGIDYDKLVQTYSPKNGYTVIQ